MEFRIIVRQLLQAALDRESEADSQVITKKAIAVPVPASALPPQFWGAVLRDRHTREVGRGEDGTFSLHCLLLLAKSCILSGTDTCAGRKVGAGSV